MSRIRLLICCDANAQSGFGHFSRCLNLARELQAEQPQSHIEFCGDFSEFAAGLLKTYQFKQFNAHHFLDGNSFFESINASYSHLLVDSYAFDQHFIDAATSGSLNCILMDDFMKHSDYSKVDLLINFTIQAHALPYRAKQVALGTPYFPVKPELKAVREVKLTASKFELRSIAICLSAMPEYKAMEMQLVELANRLLQGCKITLLSNHHAALELKGVNGNQLLLQKPGNAMEEIYRNSDYIVSGGGLVKYEAAYCAVPNATVSLTEGVAKDTAIFEKEYLTAAIGTAMEFDAASIEKKWDMELKSFNFSKFQASSKRLFDTASTKNLVHLISQLNHGKRP